MSIGLGDGLTALGLILVLEGLVVAAAPDSAKRACALMLAQPPGALRAIGLGAMAAGVLVVFLVRH
jgi:uncharacterized protein YjeT (DUF2065 family)